MLECESFGFTIWECLLFFLAEWKVGQYRQVPWSHFLGGNITARGVTPEIVFVGFLFPLLFGVMKGEGFYGLKV